MRDWLAATIPGHAFGLDAWQWIGLLLLLLLSLASFSAARLVARRVMKLRERFTGAPSMLGERSVRRGAGVLAFVLPWYLLHDQFELPALVDYRFRLAIEAVTILGVVLMLFGAWDAACDVVAHRATSVANAERLLVPVTGKLVRFFILTAGFLAALGVFGVNVTGLLAGVGIGGLVVALAAKDSVENVFGSLTILFDMPFALGDWVKIDKYEGIVEEINLRSTRIRTFEDSIITLPNSNLIKAAVENYGARRYRRQRFQIRISYANRAANLERFNQAIRKYLASVKKVVPDRTVVEIFEMTEMSVGVLVQCFVEASNFKEEAKLRGDLMLAIFRAQEESGVVFVGTPISTPTSSPPKLSKSKLEAEVRDKEDII